MDPLIALSATVALVVSVVLLHYETLLHASRLAERMTIPPRRRILVVIGAAFLAHLAEIALFAGGYWLMHLHPASALSAASSRAGRSTSSTSHDHVHDPRRW